MCDTGIALLAYMDGITNSPTLGGVVLAALSAAGYAVFKVHYDLIQKLLIIMIKIYSLILGHVPKGDGRSTNRTSSIYIHYNWYS